MESLQPYVVAGWVLWLHLPCGATLMVPPLETPEMCQTCLLQPDDQWRKVYVSQPRFSEAR